MTYINEESECDVSAIGFIFNPKLKLSHGANQAFRSTCIFVFIFSFLRLCSFSNESLFLIACSAFDHPPPKQKINAYLVYIPSLVVYSFTSFDLFLYLV